MFCWPCILVQLWINDQLDVQLRFVIRLLLQFAIIIIIIIINVLYNVIVHQVGHLPRVAALYNLFVGSFSNMFRPDLIGHFQRGFYKVCSVCFKLPIRVRLNHVGNLTKKQITQCKKLVLVLCEYKVVEITWNANLMQQGNFIDVFLARHVSGT